MPTENTLQKINRLTVLCCQLADRDFTGQLKIQFNEGGISGLERVEKQTDRLMSMEGSILQIDNLTKT